MNQSRLRGLHTVYVPGGHIALPVIGFVQVQEKLRRIFLVLIKFVLIQDYFLTK